MAPSATTQGMVGPTGPTGPTGPPGATSDWTTEINKSSAQAVSGTTLTDDTQLQISGISSGTEVWLIEAIIYHNSDSTKDFKWEITFPGTPIGNLTYYSYANVVQSGNVPHTSVRLPGVAMAAQVVGGSPGLTYIHGLMWMSGAAGAIKFRFACNTGGSGSDATVNKGSILRGRKLSI